MKKVWIVWWLDEIVSMHSNAASANIEMENIRVQDGVEDGEYWREEFPATA